MKSKFDWLAALGVILMLPLLHGCYTQVARPDRDSGDDGTYVEEQAEAPAEEVVEEVESSPQVTNVYVYDDYWAYRDPWYGWDPWYRWDPWYHRYPYRTALYIGFGYGYYNSWCGTSWWDPWCHDRYYYSYWPSHWYSPGWAYGDPVYRDHSGGDREKRPFGRRSPGGSDNEGSGGSGAVATGGSGRTSISKPVATVYDRDGDGGYRRTRQQPAVETGSRRTSVDNSGTSTQAIPVPRDRRGAIDGSRPSDNGTTTAPVPEIGGRKMVDGESPAPPQPGNPNTQSVPTDRRGAVDDSRSSAPKTTTAPAPQGGGRKTDGESAPSQPAKRSRSKESVSKNSKKSSGSSGRSYSPPPSSRGSSGQVSKPSGNSGNRSSGSSGSSGKSSSGSSSGKSSSGSSGRRSNN